MLFQYFHSFLTGSILVYILAFIIAFIMAFISTPLVKKIAFKIGAVDIPKDNRRMHKEPKALMGGLAIFFGFLVSLLLFGELNSMNLGLILGALVIVILGIVDDIKALGAKIKLLFQVIAALIVIYSGVQIGAITNPFSNSEMISLDYYGLSIILTVFWIVGVTNAVNLIDGLDGLAAGVSSIAAIFLIFIALINGRTAEALITSALVGATLGFLPFNFNPAKIFMGDTGATFLGFTLAVISIQGTMKGYTAIALAVPLLVLGLPIFDTTFAILRRIIRRKPVMEADRGHLHHRLIDAGYSHKQSVLLLYIISAFLGISGVIVTESGYIRALIVFAVVFIFMILGIKYLREAAIHQSEVRGRK